MRKQVTSRIDALDAGRALAALVVVWHHFCVFYGASIETVLRGHDALLACLFWLAQRNGEAVMFFFFISGWSIRLSMEKIAARNPSRLWTTYFIHRARRILPTYLLALGWSYLLASMIGRAGPDMSAASLVGHLLFLQTPETSKATWFAPFAGNGPLWSLSYEVWFYVSLPLVATAAGRFSRAHVFGDAMLIALSLAIGLVAVGLNRLMPFPILLIATLWPVWFAGYIFAGTAAGSRAELAIAGTVATLAIILLASARWVPSDTYGVIALGFCVGALVIVAVLLARTPMIRRLSDSLLVSRLSRGLAWIGAGSYTIYLFHYPVLILTSQKQIPGLAALALLVLLILAAPVFETKLQGAVRRVRSGPMGKFQERRP